MRKMLQHGKAYKRNMQTIGVGCLLSLVMFLTGCGKAVAEQPKQHMPQGDQVQIGMSFDSFVIERWQKDRDVFVSTAKELGAEVNVQNANGDIDSQIEQIRYLISKKVDVLVVICIDSNSLSQVIQEAKAEGIKVIAYDRLIMDGNVDLYISFDNKEVGHLMGQAIASLDLPKKRVLMLTGPTADSNVSMVEAGFREVCEENGITIVDTMYADGWKAELAADYLYDHPDVLEDIDAIMCGNDNIATTVIRVLAEKRLAGKIQVVGQDADLEACQHIMEGTQVMTVYKPVERLAQASARYAVRLAGREILPDVDQTISDGSHEVPCYVIEPIAVNKKNMDDTIIMSGFHLKEDVYLNVPKKQ